MGSQKTLRPEDMPVRVEWLTDPVSIRWDVSWGKHKLYLSPNRRQRVLIGYRKWAGRIKNAYRALHGAALAEDD